MDDLSTHSASLKLLPGERVLWRGQPGKIFVLRSKEFFLIPFSLLWAGFAVFWNATVWTDRAPFFFRLWGLPFLFAGFYIAIGRFVVDGYRLKRLRYWITNQRVVLARDGSGSIQSLDIRHLPPQSIRERPDGSGTLLFGEESLMGGRNNFGIWQATSSSPPRMIAISNVAGVYHLIQQEAGRPAG